MSKHWFLAAALAALFVPALAAHRAPVAHKTPAYVSAALADAGRSDADRQTDALRKPADMIAFAGIRPGSRVMDVMPGPGYFTRIFAKAVGDKGYVYAFVPSEQLVEIVKRFPNADVAKQFAAYPNVSVLQAPIGKLFAPEPLDVVWIAQNYHDWHDKFMGPADVAVVNKAVYDVLKPGGVYVIVDHAAKDGSGLTATETLHRIDEAAVKQEVEAAGFKFVGESSVLRNSQDPRDKLIFDPAIRHHTDQFVLKFVKPRH